MNLGRGSDPLRSLRAGETGNCSLYLEYRAKIEEVLEVPSWAVPRRPCLPRLRSREEMAMASKSQLVLGESGLGPFRKPWEGPRG